MSGRLGERLALFQKWPGILPAPNLRPARASLPFCGFYFSRGIFPGPPFWAPLPGRRRGPPRKWNLFEKGGPLFSWLHGKIKKYFSQAAPENGAPFFEKGIPLFLFFGELPRKYFLIFLGDPALTGIISFFAGRLKSRQESCSFWPAGSKAARNLAAFGRPAQKPPEIWQLLAGRLNSRQKSGSF